MPDELKPVLARQMEVYAALPRAHRPPRRAGVVDAVEDLGVLENTLVYYIIGDNGASAEGTVNGAFNEMANFNGMAALETPEFLTLEDRRARLADVLQPLLGGLGAGRCAPRCSGPSRSPRTGAAPATARSSTGPPASPSPAACARSSPTSSTSPRPILEAAGLPEPTMVNGVQQSPMEGTSMLYTFDEPDAPERHDLQYFEMFGNRGIYHRGLERRHQAPHALGDDGAPAAGVRRRRVGALRRQHRLQPGPRPGRRAPRDAREAAAAVADRGRRSTTCCRSTTAAPSGSSRRSPVGRR